LIKVNVFSIGEWPLTQRSQHVIAIFNPLIKDSGRLILKTSQMCARDAFSDASAVSPATRSPSVARSVRESWVAGITPTRSVASPVSVIQRHVSTSPPIQSPAVASVSDVRVQLSYDIRLLTCSRDSSPEEPFRGPLMTPRQISAPPPWSLEPRASLKKSSPSIPSKSMRSSSRVPNRHFRQALHFPGTRDLCHLLAQTRRVPLSQGESMFTFVLPRSVVSIALHSDLRLVRLSPPHGVFSGRQRPSLLLSHGHGVRALYQLLARCRTRPALGVFPRPRKASSKPHVVALRLFCPVPPILEGRVGLVHFRPHRSRQYRRPQVTMFPRLLDCLSASACKPLPFSPPASES
jgi:hypothetical protein